MAIERRGGRLVLVFALLGLTLAAAGPMALASSAGSGPSTLVPGDGDAATIGSDEHTDGNANNGSTTGPIGGPEPQPATISQSRLSIAVLLGTLGLAALIAVFGDRL